MMGLFLLLGGWWLGSQCHLKHLDHFPFWLISDSGGCLFDGGRWICLCFHSKDTEEAAVNREQTLLDRDPKLAKSLSTTLIFKMENAKLPQRFLTERAFRNIPQNLWSKRNTALNTKSLPILGMLLHLASLLFGWFPSSNVLYHPLSSCLSHSGDGLRCWTILDLHWLYQCKTGKSTNQAKPCFATWSLAFSPWVWLTSSDNSLSI